MLKQQKNPNYVYEGFDDIYIPQLDHEAEEFEELKRRKWEEKKAEVDEEEEAEIL